MPALDVQGIKELLPHRYPFLMVDRINTIDIDGESVGRIEGIKNVTINEEFFTGHFPQHPIMPGVLIVESMAQVAGILGLHMLGDKRTDKTSYYFAGADKVRFKKPVVPGDQLILNGLVIDASGFITGTNIQVVGGAYDTVNGTYTLKTCSPRNAKTTQ